MYRNKKMTIFSTGIFIYTIVNKKTTVNLQEVCTYRQTLTCPNFKEAALLKRKKLCEKIILKIMTKTDLYLFQSIGRLFVYWSCSKS